MQNTTATVGGTILFESFVNSERCKTIRFFVNPLMEFESFVNSERCKTFGRTGAAY